MLKKHNILFDATLMCGKGMKPSGIVSDNRSNLNLLLKSQKANLTLFSFIFRSRYKKSELNRFQRLLRNIKRIFLKLNLGIFSIKNVAHQTKTLDELECVFSGVDKSLPVIGLHGYARKVDASGWDFIISPWVTNIKFINTTHIIRHHDCIPFEFHKVCTQSTVSHFTKALNQNVSVPNTIFVCVSQPTADKLLARYPHLKDRVFCVPYVYEKLKYETTETFTKPTERYIAMCSTIEPRKNHEIALKAIEILHKKYPNENLKLVIIGNWGWKYEKIQAEIARLTSIGCCIHLQGVSDEYKDFLLANAACFLFPSIAEGFGVPPLEALNLGTPSVVSDIPEHKYVLSEKGALFCSTTDAHDVATKLEQLVFLDKDESKKKEILEAGLISAKRFTPENVLPEWERVFNYIANKKKKGS